MLIDSQIFQIILLVMGISSTVIIAYLFKYIWKPRQDVIFSENRLQTIKTLFYNLSYIDSYKKTIFEYLEKQENFDVNKTNFLTVSKPVYDEIFRFQELIDEKIKTIVIMQKYLVYVTVEQYIIILQYASSAYSFIHKISNEELGIGISRKSLEYHRYYAKKIIDLFGKDTPEYFKTAWEKEFAKIGGSHQVKQPKVELGDTITSHHNMGNELLYYDYYFSTIMEKLREIEKDVKKLQQ